jgi:hypothetical protein
MIIFEIVNIVRIVDVILPYKFHVCMMSTLAGEIFVLTSRAIRLVCRMNGRDFTMNERATIAIIIYMCFYILLSDMTI